MSRIEENIKKHIPSLVEVWRDSCKKNNSNSSQMLTYPEIQIVSKALLDLQRGLTGTRRLAGAGYMDNTSYLGAYLLYYWPVSYLQISYAMNDILKNKTSVVFPQKKIRILDLGSGPAPASAAVIDTLAAEKNISFECTLIDSSNKTLAYAQRVFAKEYPTVQLHTQVCDFEKQPVVEGKYDIIVMCHALNELWGNKPDYIEQRVSFIKRAASCLEPDGLMLLCEPSLLATSRSLIAVRDVLVKEDFSVVSPCPCFENKCPVLLAGENQTCHADVLWSPCQPVLSLAQGAGLDRESVKMTFFAIKKNAMIRKMGEPDTLLEKKEAQKAVTVSGRIVSEGMLNKAGRIRFLLCNGKERLAVSANQNDAHAKQIGFFSLRRYDFILLKNPQIRGDKTTIAYGIQENTEIEIARFSE